jgi:hypothetical protein
LYCLECDKLLAEANTAVREHQALAAEAAELAGTGNPEFFAKLSIETREACTKAKAAMAAYRQHLTSHDDTLSQPSPDSSDCRLKPGGGIEWLWSEG